MLMGQNEINDVSEYSLIPPLWAVAPLMQSFYQVCLFFSFNLQDGRVYMVDFEILEGIPHYGQTDENLKRRYTCPALGLFYVRRNGDTVPIAIQFFQEPSETNPIWTPNDSEMDWIYAKMWLRNADTQWHQVSFV